MIMNKILFQKVDKSALIKDFKNIYISYIHKENCFIVNLLKEKHRSTDYTKLDKTLDNGTEARIKIEKNTFIKNVLQSIRYPSMQPETNAKKIVIDFSSPNIAKPFHVGHMRSTIIGNFIANINNHYNNKVTRINYLGDWGTQFGLLQYGLKNKNITIDDLQANPLKILYDVYVYANKMSTEDQNVKEQAKNFFSDIEQGRTDLQTWKKIREITVKELEKVYSRLGISFDEYHWESDYNGRAIKELINSLEDLNIISTDASGKKIVTINDRDVTILKSDHSTLYLSRDVAALLDRYKKYKFDKMLYVVDNAQTDHFAAVFEIVKKINRDCSERCEHVKFGRIKGMSTRSGNVVFLDDILNEAKEKMHEKQTLSKNTRNSAMNDNTCDILGTSAVIINDLKQRRQRDYVFEWNRVLQSDGDSAIKLQYLHCRLWSLEQNCGISIPNICDPVYLTEEIIGDVIVEFTKFDYVLHRSFQEYEACILVGYLFRLAKCVNKMFNEVRVKGIEPDTAAQRLLVFHCARLIIKNGLNILGVRPLYEM